MRAEGNASRSSSAHAAAVMTCSLAVARPPSVTSRAPVATRARDPRWALPPAPTPCGPCGPSASITLTIRCSRPESPAEARVAVSGEPPPMVPSASSSRTTAPPSAGRDVRSFESIRSTSSSSSAATEMRFNTTEHLIRDIEALRVHLGVDRWLVSGGSWGSTLALAYAQRYPSRASELVLNSVTTSRRAAAKGLYTDLAHLFPDAWEQFRRHGPDANAAGVIAANAGRR